MDSLATDPTSLKESTPLDSTSFLESLTEIEYRVLVQLVIYPFLRGGSTRIPTRAFYPLSKDILSARKPPSHMYNLAHRCARLGLFRPVRGGLWFTRAGLSLAVGVWKRWSMPKEHLGWILEDKDSSHPRVIHHRYYPASFVTTIEDWDTELYKVFWCTYITVFQNTTGDPINIHYTSRRWEYPPTN